MRLRNCFKKIKKSMRKKYAQAHNLICQFSSYVLFNFINDTYLLLTTLYVCNMLRYLCFAILDVFAS